MVCGLFEVRPEVVFVISAWSCLEDSPDWARLIQTTSLMTTLHALTGRGATVAKRPRKLSAHYYGNRRNKMQTLWTPEDGNNFYNAIHAPTLQVSTEIVFLQYDIKIVLRLFALWRTFLRLPSIYYLS